LRRYKAKRVKTRCYQERVGHLEPKFQGKGAVPGEHFFGFYKTRHILLSDSANCIVLRAVVLTQYRRVTDGQTDRRTYGIAVASTALAMRRAVKNLTGHYLVAAAWAVRAPHYPARPAVSLCYCYRVLFYQRPDNIMLMATSAHPCTTDPPTAHHGKRVCLI